MIIKHSASAPSISRLKYFIQPTLCWHFFPMKVLPVKIDLLAQLTKKMKAFEWECIVCYF